MANTAVVGAALAGVDDGDLAAVSQQQRAAVTGLPAAQRVKHGAVQHDALRRDGGHRGAAFGLVSVGAKKVLCHARHFRSGILTGLWLGDVFNHRRRWRLS